MKKLLRTLAGACALVLCAGSFAGCGLFGNKTKLPDKQKVNHVYKYEEKTLYTVKRETDEDKVTVRENVYDTLANAEGYMFLVNKSDKDYNDIGYTMHYGKYDGEDMTVELPKFEAEDGYVYFSNLARFADGFGLVEERNTLIDKENYEYKRERYFHIYGEDGTLKSTVDLMKAFGENSNFGIDRVLMQGDTLYLSYYNDNGSMILQAMGMDGTLGKIIPIFPEGTDGYISSMLFTEDGKLLAGVTTFGSDSSKQSIVTIDLATGERTELDTNNDYQLINTLFAGPDGSLYCSDQNAIYAVDKTTLAKTEILNYINSDYIYRYGSYSMRADGSIVTFSGNYDSDTQTNVYRATVFTKVADEDVPEKYILTVASAGNAYNLQEQIVKFNRASDEYRIKYVDYSQYNTNEDYTLGQTRLGDDILAGNVPDVLIADQQFSVSKYVSKGLFADLYTFIDKDESMQRTDFLENIFAGCEIDGKLYEIPTNFYVQGLIGPKETMEQFKNLTIREFADKIKTLPEGTSFFRDGDVTRGDLLQTMFLINYSNFVDRTTGKCSINNDECRALLEFAKTLPEKSLWDRENFDSETFDWDAYNNMFKDGKAIAQTISIGDFSNLQDYAYSYADGTELAFIGFPAPDRSGASFISADLKFLVSAKGAFPDAAWDFVKIFLSDEYQASQGWGFPVKKTALDAKRQEVLDQIEEDKKRREEEGDGSDGEIIGIGGMGGFINDAIYYRRDLNEEDVQVIYDYATSATKQFIYDTSLFDIITEEASAYFAGTKTLDEILPLMESRITIFLSEGR